MHDNTVIKKIVVIGPESTGKSTLCKLLAANYNTVWCPEYAREYLLKQGPTYTYDDLLKIAEGQLELEDQYLSMINNPSTQSFGQDELTIEKERSATSNEPPIIKNIFNLSHTPSAQTTLSDTHNPFLLFIDTDMYVMKVWCEYVYGKCHQFILDNIVTRRYHLYLLCNIDLPWTEDPLREYPDDHPRMELYKMYKDILLNQQVPWADINGDYDQRLQKAIRAIEKYLY